MKTRQLQVQVAIMSQTIGQILPTGQTGSVLLAGALRNTRAERFMAASPQSHTQNTAVSSYHAVVQHPIGQRRVLGVLAVQILADHRDVGLLTHLLSRLHPEADVASANKQGNRGAGVKHSPRLVSFLLCVERFSLTAILC